jgi:hypothetical protein
MSETILRTRSIVTSTPAPLSPRPNRERAPLHQPTVEAILSIDDALAQAPAWTGDYRFTLNRIASNFWNANITCPQGGNFTLGIQWLPEVEHMDAAIDLKLGSMIVQSNAIADMHNTGILDWVSNGFYWDGRPHASTSVLQIITNGPWQRFHA